MVYNDEPISDASADSFERVTFARKLASFICGIDPDSSIVIGVHGPWGSGKTSLINLALNEMSDASDITAIHFNPWGQLESDSVVKEFFCCLKEELSIHYDGELQTEVSAAIGEYADAFGTTVSAGTALMGIPVPKSIPSTIGKRLARRAGGSKERDLGSVSLRKEKVSKALAKSDRRVLVVIDDIDRLHDEQIRLIFQLVASIADFPRVSYLLAFDRDVVVQALDGVQRGYGAQYLEKIVQVPIRVPELSEQISERITSNEIERMICADKGPVEFAPDIERVREVQYNHVLRFTNSPRNMNRFLNAFSFELACASNSIDTADLLGLTALKVFMPNVFSWMLRHSDDVLGQKSRTLRMSLKAPENRQQFYLDELTQCFNDVAEAEGNARAALDVLVSLFPRFAQSIGRDFEDISDSGLRVQKRIASPDLFSLYCDGLLEKDPFPNELIQRAVSEMAVEELDALFQEKLSLCDESVFFGMQGRVNTMALDRKRAIYAGLLSALAKGVPFDNELNELSEPLRLLNALARGVGKEHAAGALVTELPKFNLSGLLALGHWLYGQCFVFGLFGEGAIRRRDQLFSEEDFDSIAKAFAERLALALDGQNAFEYAHPRTALLVWMAVDEHGCRQYLENLFEDPAAVMSCLLHDVQMDSSSRSDNLHKWHISWEFEKFISIDGTQFAINECINNGIVDKLAGDDRTRIAAMSIAMDLYNRNHVKEDSVSSNAVLERLAKWGVGA